MRDYVFLGTTQSLCPECLELVTAKIISRKGRVYFRKRCPTHGEREDFVCSDVSQYDQLEYAVPAKVPQTVGVTPQRGCPYDCGLCTEHEQHTCVGLVELTSSCNLNCPMCYAASGPGGQHVSFEDCCRAIDRLVEVEGRPEVLQLSGGEPTIHPEFPRILEYALQQPIDYVMVNTNGVRFAHDPQLVALLAEHPQRIEIYFQLDGLDDRVFEQLRGEPLLKIKTDALQRLGEAGLQVTLVSTLQPGVNEDQLGALIRYGAARPWVSGISFQPATYSGRHVLPEELERRLTFPDIIQRIEQQTDGWFTRDDFMPLPCAHPNCHSLAFAFRDGADVVPLTRFIDARNHLELLANGISFRREQAQAAMQQYLASLACCGGGNCGDADPAQPQTLLPILELSPQPPADAAQGGPPSELSEQAVRFFERAMRCELGSRDLFRITITSFLDAYNFDVRRVMKCCTHHVLPSGHVIPFCAYNVLYRNGHVPLPELDRLASPQS